MNVSRSSKKIDKLFDAICRNDMAMVERYVYSRPVDLSGMRQAWSMDRVTPLHAAITAFKYHRSRSERILTMLVDGYRLQGLSIDRRGEGLGPMTPLGWSVWREYLGPARILLASGADPHARMDQTQDQSIAEYVFSRAGGSELTERISGYISDLFQSHLDAELMSKHEPGLSPVCANHDTPHRL